MLFSFSSFLVSIKSLHLRFMNCDLFICIYVLWILAYQLPLVGCKLTDAVLVLLQNKTFMDKLLSLV